MGVWPWTQDAASRRKLGHGPCHADQRLKGLLSGAGLVYTPAAFSCTALALGERGTLDPTQRPTGPELVRWQPSKWFRQPMTGHLACRHAALSNSLPEVTKLQASAEGGVHAGSCRASRAEADADMQTWGTPYISGQVALQAVQAMPQSWLLQLMKSGSCAAYWLRRSRSMTVLPVRGGGGGGSAAAGASVGPIMGAGPGAGPGALRTAWRCLGTVCRSSARQHPARTDGDIGFLKNRRSFCDAPCTYTRRSVPRVME